MTCDSVKFPDGGWAIICSRGGGRKPPCAYCRGRSAVLCDGPHPSLPGKTCDRPMCRDHAYHEEPDRDLCRACRPASETERPSMRMPFGRWKGELVENVPSDYLRWALETWDKDSEERRALAKEMAAQLEMREGRGVSR